DLDRDLPVLGHASFAATRGARFGDHLAGAAALRTGAGDGEEPLLEADLPLAAALRADGGRAPGLGSRSVAGLAGLLPRDLHRGFGAVRRLLERDLEVVAQIGAALRPA